MYTSETSELQQNDDFQLQAKFYLLHDLQRKRRSLMCSFVSWHWNELIRITSPDWTHARPSHYVLILRLSAVQTQFRTKFSVKYHIEMPSMFLDMKDSRYLTTVRTLYSFLCEDPEHSFASWTTARICLVCLRCCHYPEEHDTVLPCLFSMCSIHGVKKGIWHHALTLESTVTPLAVIGFRLHTGAFCSR